MLQAGASVCGEMPFLARYKNQTIRRGQLVLPCLSTTGRRKRLSEMACFWQRLLVFEERFMANVNNSSLAVDFVGAPRSDLARRFAHEQANVFCYARNDLSMHAGTDY